MTTRTTEVTNRAAYELLHDTIHVFKTTAKRIDSEVRELGIRDNSAEEVEGTGRSHVAIWLSMKTVSHFNLGTALELMLKLLLHLNHVPIPHHHRLTELHDKIPGKFQKQLEFVYQASREVCPDGYRLVAFNSDLEEPDHPANRTLSTVRELFVYFDQEVEFGTKRYSWELAESGCWMHYVSDISVFVELIDRVMHDIER